MDLTTELAQSVELWRVDPVSMVHELFQAEPDNWQAQGLAAFSTNPHIAVKSARGLGRVSGLVWVAFPPGQGASRRCPSRATNPRERALCDVAAGRAT